jgi:hypothetical protein
MSTAWTARCAEESVNLAVREPTYNTPFATAGEEYTLTVV